MRGKGKRVDSSFQSANLYIIPTYTRVYINKETRVAKFPALSRVIKFKHRAQGWGDGFCREGMERGAWWSEKPLGRQDVRVHTGCPERIEHEVVFLRVNKKTFLQRNSIYWLLEFHLSLQRIYLL